MEVDPSGTAARAGLREGDVILQVNRRAVESASDASKILQQVRSGGTALMLIWRQNQEIFLTVRRSRRRCAECRGAECLVRVLVQC